MKPLLSMGQKLRAAISIAGFIILAYVYNVYLLQPALAKTAASRQALIEAEKKPIPVSSEQAQAAEMKEKVRDLKSRKRSLDAVFLKEKNIPPLTRTIRTIAQKNSIDLRDSVKVAIKEQKGHFVKAESTLTGVGRHEDIRKFLSALAEEGCLIKTTDMAATEAKGLPVIKMSVSLVYYRYNK